MRHPGHGNRGDGRAREQRSKTQAGWPRGLRDLLRRAGPVELRPVSLRTRLLIGLVGLTVAGLTIASVVVYAAERSFLISRVDQLFAPNTVLGFEGYIDRQLH